MKFILEYNNYSKNNQSLRLSRDVILSNSDRIKIGKLIASIMEDIYGDNLLSDDIFTMDGKDLNPEYLRKARNNRNLLKKLVYDKDGIIKSNVKTKEDLYSFIEDNSMKLFNPSGFYFKTIYNLLTNSSNKGKSIEERSFELFKNTLKDKRGVDVDIIDPTKEQDIDGIDGLFMYKGKEFTIQVKPLSYMQSYKKDDTKYIVFCDGVLKNLKTDYLIVLNDNESHIFKSDNSVAYDSYFLIPKSNLIV